MVDFLTFMVADSPAKAAEFNAILAIFRASVAATHPGATVFVATDRETPVTAPDVTVLRGDVDPAELLYARAVAYRAFVDGDRFTSDLALLDYDIIVNKPIDQLFSIGFDVAVTYRNWHRTQPINGGMVLLSRNGRAAVQRFYGRVVERYGAISDPEERRWSGDQLALAAAIGLPPPPLATGRLTTRTGERILLLPAEEYNHSYLDGHPPAALPQTLDDAMLAVLHSKPILHFKGPRKALMASFWADRQARAA